jgi:DNA helicase-2/ATP-dependent DNA helicase PcrA
VQVIKAAAGQLIAAPLMERVNFYAWSDLGLRILKEHVSAIKRKLPLKVEMNSSKILQKLIAKYSKELDPTALELCGDLDETTAAKMISLYKANLVSAQTAKERAINEREKLLAKVYIAYEDQMQKANKIDVDDMVSMAANLLGQDSDLRLQYQNLFEHIIVDEYQDATVACDFLSRLLAFPNDNLIVIGNEDEACFEQEGAAPQLLGEISIRAPETSCYKLGRNWRSHPQITKQSDQFAQYIATTTKSSHHVEKTTIPGWGELPTNGIIGVSQCFDTLSEVSWMADQIKSLVAQGRALDDIAIICRSKERIASLSETFLQKGLVLNSTSQELNLLPDESGDVLAFLKLVVDPDGPRAREYFEHICKIRSKPIAPKLSTTILSWAESFNLSYLKAVEMYAEVAGDPDCAPFGQLIERIRDMHHNKMPPTDIIRLLKMPQWLGNYYQSMKLPPGVTYEPLAVMTEMEEKARIFKTVADFVKSYSPTSRITQQDTKSQAALNLLSIAEAKGREFRVVFLPNLVQGILPDETNFNQEEECRLFYISLTRARELLYLSCCEQIDGIAYSPSQFLEEAGVTVTPITVNVPRQQISVKTLEATEENVSIADPLETLNLDPASTAPLSSLFAGPETHEEIGHEIIEEFMELAPKPSENINLETAVQKVLRAEPVNQCTNCQISIEKGARFCGNCGAVQTGSQRICKGCGAFLHQNEKFCGECGANN